MPSPVVTFFNNKGGVGKTSLVYHLSWMYADLGYRVLAADMDPQGNLSAAFLDEDRLEAVWPGDGQPKTVFGSLRPLIRGVGDIDEVHLEPITLALSLVIGDMALSDFEDQLSEVWPKCNDGDERSFRVMSAFWRLLQNAAGRHRADLILVDLGPNLGAINRAALIATGFVVIPLGPDLFSLQGLRNLGPAIHRWRREWHERVEKNPDDTLSLPEGTIQPVGYVVLQHSVRLDRPVKAYDRWISRIPGVYQQSVLRRRDDTLQTIETDPNCIAALKHYRSLMPMAQEARKPIFHLKPADGALGAHTSAVRDAYSDFKALALAIADRTGIGTA